MEAININWHETFSFFISDIEYYHQVSTERLGVIFQSVLKHHEPSEVTDSPPLPWCSLLRDLMKVLRCQLGNQAPESRCTLVTDNLQDAISYLTTIPITLGSTCHTSSKASHTLTGSFSKSKQQTLLRR